jgi:GrpB-like predicted nucleotidyltransferase (UPF0157 family)
MSIIIKEYDPKWKYEFESLKEVLSEGLKHLHVDIQHVGSTSVVGLAAKPVIDIDIIIECRELLTPILKVLRSLGYDHVGDLGIVDREAFHRQSEATPIDRSNKVWHKHNLYVCSINSISLRNHLVFRDYLRSHPEEIIIYGDLKRQIVSNNASDLNLYCEAKTPYITNILNSAGIEADVLNEITLANQQQLSKQRTN